MRFKKASLVAASLLLSSLPALAVDIPYAWADDPNAPAGAQLLDELTSVVVGAGDVAVLNDNGRYGIMDSLDGAGSFVKQGSGLLRIDGNWFGRDSGLPSFVYGAEGSRPNSHNGTIVTSPGFIENGGAMTGSLTVQGGTLELSGRVNQWVEVPANMFTARVGGELAWMTNNAYMAGVSGVVLANSGTEITFTNTGLNVANGLNGSLGGSGGNVVLRYNMVRNIKSGVNNDIADTTFSAGIDSSYRIVIYSDNTAANNALNPALAALGSEGNSIGTLAGAGSVYKFGAADLKILGESERGIGSFTIAGGSVTLASAGGAALSTATAVNLAGADSQQGLATKAVYKWNPGGNPNDFWQNSITPTPETGKLVILNNQTIRNLQADFAVGATGANIEAAIWNAASSTSAGEAVIAGTGKGSVIDIGSNTLTITQDRDGVYRGNVVATTDGKIVKSGSATLALLLGVGTNASISVTEGRLLANAQGLGSGSVDVSGSGSLAIFQDNAGTLNAALSGSSAISVIASAFVNNGVGNIQLNTTQKGGTLMIGRVQDGFTGAFHVYDAVTLEFTKATPDALAKAESVTLHGSDWGATTARFGDGIHNINRLSGDAGTKIDLSRGEAVLHQSGEPLVFAGAIAGAGNLVQVGGDWTVTGSLATHVGATVVRSELNTDGSVNSAGKLTQSGASGMGATSGLVLGTGATFVAGDANTQVGALFGQAGSTVALGAGTLTVGFNAQRAALLSQELAGGTPLSTNYLGTSATALDLGGATIAQFDTALVTGSPVTPVDVADATRLFLARQYAGTTTAAADAASLAFAGTITGTGGLTKIGSETLTLTGVNTYTGLTSVQGGTLRVDWDAIGSTAGVAVSAGATFSILADASTGDGVFNRTLSGAGTLQKVGDGKITLSGSLTGFTGGVSVAEGTLQLNSAGALAGAVSVDAGATLVFNQATDSVAAATVANAGTLEKTGAGRLQLGTYSGAGAVTVSQGTLALTNFPVPSAPAALTVASGATFEATLVGDGITPVVSATQVQGAGTVSLVGSGTNPTLQAGAADLFATVTLDLRGGVTFDLNGTTQTLGGFSGDAASSIALNAGILRFDIANGTSTAFAGNLTGAGALVKDGDGTVSLTTTTVQTWTGTVTVNAGTLVATPQALGANDVTLAGGTFALHNADTTMAQTYANTVSGNGTLSKTGAGEVILSNGATGVIGLPGQAGVQVREGRLTTSDAGTDAVFSSVSVASGASFRVDMTGDRLHDAATANKVTGAGDLVVSGTQTLTLSNGQSYTGLTELLNGASLTFANTPSISGLAGQSGTSVVLTGDLTIDQARSAAYAGTFAGTGVVTVAGPGTLDLTQAGASGDLAGLDGLTVATGGKVVLSAANTLGLTNTGTVEISVASGTQQYTGAITGTGAVTKVGAGKLTLGTLALPYTLGSTGDLTVSAGTLGGTFITSGDLVVASGATLAPGNSPGVVTVNGDFTLASGSTLEVEVNSVTSDRVLVSGTATLAGALNVKQDSTPGALPPAAGQKYTVITAAGGITGSFSNATNGFVFLDAAQKLASGLDRVHLDVVGDDLVMTGVAGLADIAGYDAHEGLGGLVAVLDAKGAPAAVQTAVDTTWGPSINATLANLSPLGYASEYAMAQDGESRRQSLLHDRLEQRRYDRASTLSTEDAPSEAFLVGGGVFADNDDALDTPTFDYRTFGGLVGLDTKLSDDLLVGAAIGYDSGKATLKNSGGKVDMNRMAATAFLSTQINRSWYLDAGASAGIGLYESERNTVVGKVTGDNTGFSGGLHVETGTIVVLAKDVHLTPYLGAAYTHHEFGSIDESGAASALKVDSWSQDSLRAKVGAGLGWFVPADWGKLKLGLDVAYSHEMLDTDSDLDARFASAAGSKFSTTAAAIPQDAISLSPSLGVQFDETTSASLSYTYEMGFDARSYQSVNFAIRKRF